MHLFHGPRGRLLTTIRTRPIRLRCPSADATRSVACPRERFIRSRLPRCRISPGISRAMLRRLARFPWPVVKLRLRLATEKKVKPFA